MENEQETESPSSEHGQPGAQAETPRQPDVSVEATQHIENFKEAYDQHNVNKVDIYYSAGGNESEKIDFSTLALSTGAGSQLPFGPDTVKRFGESRMLLISHGPSHDEQAAELIDHVIRQYCPGLQDAVCCTLQLQPAFPVSRLISEFRASSLYGSDRAQALVVFENRETTVTASFLSAFTRKGGPANSLSLQLSEQNIWLIYAGQQTALPETSLPQELHAAYCLINTLVLDISRELGDRDKAMSIYLEVTRTSRLTGWLRSSPEADIAREVIRLLKADLLSG